MQQLKDTTIQLVKEFHEHFGHPVENTPIVPDIETQKFRYSLITNPHSEDTGEAEEALESTTVEDLADALGDLQYVLDGWFLVSGLHYLKDDIVKEIHASNMSKLCKSFEEVNDTIARLREKSPGEYFTYKKVGIHYAVYNSVGKVMKSINYFKPNLKRIISG